MAMVFGIGFLLLTSMFVSTMLAAMAHRIAGDAAFVTTLLDTAAHARGHDRRSSRRSSRSCPT
jgi:hypothetical protein